MNRAYLVGKLSKQKHQLQIDEQSVVDLLIHPNFQERLKDVVPNQCVQIVGEIWSHPTREKSATVKVISINTFPGDSTPSSFVTLNVNRIQWFHQKSFNSNSSIFAYLPNSQPVFIKMPFTESRWAKTVGGILSGTGDADFWASFKGQSELVCSTVVEDRTGSCAVLPAAESCAVDEKSDSDGSVQKKKKSKRVGIGPKLRHEIFLRDEFTCRYCGASPSKDKSVIIEVDHIVPVSKGGTNEKNNLQTLCDACNAGKGNSMPVIDLGDPWFK